MEILVVKTVPQYVADCHDWSTVFRCRFISSHSNHFSFYIRVPWHAGKFHRNLIIIILTTRMVHMVH